MVPEAFTRKTAFLPAAMVSELGWDLMTGAVPPAVVTEMVKFFETESPVKLDSDHEVILIGYSPGWLGMPVIESTG